MDFTKFIINPIIPVPVMAAICVVLLVFKRKGITPYIRQILIVLLLFLINLRPMYPDDNITIQKSKIDINIIFVVDDTISMLAEDEAGYPTRMDRAKADMFNIIDSLPGARFSVIAFNNDTNVLSPFTDSEAYLKNAIDAIAPIPSMYANGTNISVCFDALNSVVSNSETMGDYKTMIFFFTDGENTDDNRLVSFSRIGERISGGAVIGYGTPEGGTMHYRSTQYGEPEVIMDIRGNNHSEAVSRIDEDNLRQLAEDLNVPYIHSSDIDSLQQQLDSIRAEFEAEPEEELKTGYADVYFCFAALLIPIVAYEFISLKRRG